MNLFPRSALAGTTAIESWVRPFQAPPSLLQRALDAIPPEASDVAANDRFGKPTPIDLMPKEVGGLLSSPGIRRTFTWTDPAKIDDQKEEDIVLVYNEVARETKTTRITNPDDATIWIDVEDATSITFDGPDGYLRQFVFVPR